MSIDHIIINAKNLKHSVKFYGWLLPRLGYGKKFDDTDGDWQIGWANEKGGSFWIKKVDERFKSDAFHKDRVGLCEIAFRVKSRKQVDQFAKEFRKRKVRILDEPREYNYVPGYYAAFFADPDGIKLEIVYYPQ